LKYIWQLREPLYFFLERYSVKCSNKISMNTMLLRIKDEVYNTCDFKLTRFANESESREYDACRFHLNGLSVICRNGKITPKKTGQFVTFWKRDGHKPIAPFQDTDEVDFFVVNVRTKSRFGQFVFPRSVLIDKGIISTQVKDGKRAFRVYPSWDSVGSKQAEKTRKWQLEYFYEISGEVDFELVKELYLG
jgi:hypothetical protein